MPEKHLHTRPEQRLQEVELKWKRLNLLHYVVEDMQPEGEQLEAEEKGSTLQCQESKRTTLLATKFPQKLEFNYLILLT